MGRPREFDRQEALQAAMRVFWARGFDGTSLCDLIGAMGISKSSFYEAFGSKHDIFLASLDHYRHNVIGLLSLKLETAKSPRAAIVAALRMVLDQTPGPEDTQGCMLGRCAVELAGRDLAAAARVTSGMAQIEDALHGAVVRAQGLGEIPAKHDARALARFLTSSFNGLRVMADAKADRATLEDVLRLTIMALD